MRGLTERSDTLPIVVDKNSLDNRKYNYLPAGLRGRVIFGKGNRMDNNELGTNLAEVGTDAISRQSAIEVIERARAHIGHNTERAVGRVFLEMLDDVGLSISKLPSIQPRREDGKIGEWIYDWGDWDFETCKCSECGNHSRTEIGKRYNFCPYCGADMRGEQDEMQ